MVSNNQNQGGKKDRVKTVYFPKALQGRLKEYLKVKAKRGKSLLSEVTLLKILPAITARNSFSRHPSQAPLHR